MALFDKMRRRGIGNPVRGTAQVVSCSTHHGRATYQTCHMELVISADGVPPRAVAFDGLVHRKHWPVPGVTLAVTVDRENPESFRIDWDEMPTSRELAQGSAEALAAAMRGEESSSSTPDVAGAAKDGPAAEPAGSDAAEDEARLARLERLAALRAQGVLTDEEFEEQKRRILD